MTIGPHKYVDTIRGIASGDEKNRSFFGSAFGFWFAGYDGPDGDEQTTAAPAHVWAMCIEPAEDARESLLGAASDFAELDHLAPVRVEEIMGWLAVTGTSRAEVDYVEVFQEILDRTGARAEVPLTPERSAPLVDVLRGVTSTLATERRDAARVVPATAAALRDDEAGCFAGVLARVLALETDGAAREAQLRAVIEAAERGVLDGGGRVLVAEALATTDVDPQLRARWESSVRTQSDPPT